MIRNLLFSTFLVWCCMLSGKNKTDGFWVRARRKPQRYPQGWRGFATQPWRKRRGFMCQIACNTTLALASLLPVPTLAQKAVFTPEVESLVKAQSPESVKASLRQDAGARRSAPAAPEKTAPSEDKHRRDDLRMLVVALLLMVAIAIRRYRSDAR